jgi:subtilisin family serine protease
MKKITLLLCLLIASLTTFSQEYNYQFRLSLKDKGKTPFSIKKPEKFLSPKAIERRERQGIKIDETDLPISPDYFKAIQDLGGIVIAKSKWLNTITIHCTDSAMIDKFTALPFVSDALFVWRGKMTENNARPDTIEKYPAKEEVSFGNYYGKADTNIKLNNGQYLHEAGFKGKGIDIAVLDGGFNHLPKIEMLDNVDIKGSKGFIYNFENLFENAGTHGLSVMSCIATNKPMQFVGTAPEASFWLFSSEDTRSEFPVEEDYWAAAIEYADSVGVDVTNTSLGYSNFDFPAKSHTHQDIDGKTAHISRAASMAAEKGILLVISAGNSGDSEWRKITPPSDAANVLTAGAIQRDSTIARFSSRGLTADLRIKPDLMTLGVGSTVMNDRGLVSYSSGTSFSSPIMCGMVACLWQAFPTLTNKEILQVMRESGDRADMPDEDFGYGIPDMKKAMEIAQVIADRKAATKSDDKKDKKKSKK